MKTSKSNLFAILVIGAAVLATSNASAGGFNFGGGGGGGGNKGGFKVTFGGSNHNHKFHNDHHGHHHHKHHHHHHNHVKYYRPVHVLYSRCYHPQFRFCFVYPGDSWFTISKQMCGVDFLGRHVASYNGLSLYTRLMPGQQIRLPVVNTDGSLSASGAPFPPVFAPQGIPVVGQPGPIGPQTTQFAPQASMAGPQASMVSPQGLPAGLASQGLPSGVANMQAPSAGSAPQGAPASLNNSLPQGLPNGLNTGSIGPQGVPTAPVQKPVIKPSVPATTTIASIRTVKEEPTLPRVAIGSTLTLDGESLGNEKGIVRLEINGMILPVEVIEWTASSVKIELPKIDLSRPVKADLEVLRADGSLASSSPIELSPAATRLALGN